ncbi:hypothetical protein [Pseudonocardia asaccharolytica]|uniref:IclR-ED domain-containing protein n=1 Tax=Pseudonocardia asaccharolytica DSM 44247 = NBRC 16224 TaxID=1123024 RepID=A0A511D4A2_9PSEU|nr:hypothetical protein [Pseudonocardia asaccharolytica]GEL19626.1 hypothetical protein PA7_34630 [Pseudonocardia asaccharolytica DSM 44247 = NBRC 16224]
MPSHYYGREAGLEHAGYVERDPTSGRFRLGLGLLALAGPLPAPRFRMPAQMIEALVHDVVDATKEISARLGHAG